MNTLIYKTRALSPYPSATIREFLYISLPLIFSTISVTLMFFLDRLVLAQYSIQALDTAVVSSMGCFATHIFFFSMAAIGEVFVGQYYGSKQYDSLSIAVWQMIYFALFSSIVFVPLAFWGYKIYLPKEYWDVRHDYYTWFMGSGTLYVLIPALTSFFIGQGKVRFITFTVILGNILNVIFDICFVFGITDLIPEMGARGAVLATILSSTIQVFILFFVFLNRKNRILYKTSNYRFNIEVLFQCIKIGSPNALAKTVEMLVWVIILHLIAKAGSDFITVFSIGQGFFILFNFATEGLQKSTIAISSNLMGANKKYLISKALKIAIAIHLLLVIIIALPSLIYADTLTMLFLNANLIQKNDISPAVIAAASYSMYYLCCYFASEGLVGLLAGVLISSGRTTFIFKTHLLNAWLFAIIPMYLILVLNRLQLYTYWQVIVVYSCMNLLVIAIGYSKNIWFNNKVLIY